MAFEVTGFRPGVLKAGADLSDHQHRAVKLNNAGDVVKSTEGDRSIGILQNKPVSGEAAEIEMDGISKAVIGETIANAGGELMSDANGKLVAATSTNAVVALLIENGAADGEKKAVKVVGAAGRVLA